MIKPYSLALYDRVANGNALIGDVTDQLRPTWRRSIRRIGDYWLGTAEIRLERSELDDFFLDGILREIRETTIGDETWRGAIVRMEYTRGAYTFVRDVTTLANAIRSIYTSIGDNLLTNGSGESGAWTAYNSATVTQDATWSTNGTYSVKVVVADTVIRGATVQTGITISAGQQYIFRATLKVTSGSWRLAVNRSDNDASLAFFSTKGRTGDIAVEVSIADSNTYSGTVLVRVTSEASAGTINLDALVLQAGPLRAETGWYTDANSIAEFGRKEDILLRAGQSNAAANAECQSELLKRSWPQPEPPRTGQTLDGQASGDVLKITFAGYWAMLNWLYTTLSGTKTCAAWVTALAALQSTYVSASYADANITDFYVEDRAPLLVGDLLREVTLAGSTGGALYSVGVGAGRVLNYAAAPAVLSYIMRHGRLCSLSGEELEPSLVRPGWMLFEDMPIGPGWLSASAQHDPRWVYLEEVEMLPPTPNQPDGSIAFNLD
jgi:hypothetical protein